MTAATGRLVRMRVARAKLRLDSARAAQNEGRLLEVLKQQGFAINALIEAIEFAHPDMLLEETE